MNTTSKSQLQPLTHRVVLGGHLLGHGIQGGSGLGTNPARGHHHHLALLGRELGEDVGLEAPQHDCLLQQQLQLPQVGGAGIIPPPGVLWRRTETHVRPQGPGTGLSPPLTTSSYPALCREHQVALKDEYNTI